MELLRFTDRRGQRSACGSAHPHFCRGSPARKFSSRSRREGPVPYRAGHYYIPVDCIILPPKVDFAKSHPLRAFKTPFWRAHALQRHSLGPSKPSHWATTHVVLVVPTVSWRFKNWATSWVCLNSALRVDFGQWRLRRPRYHP